MSPALIRTSLSPEPEQHTIKRRKLSLDFTSSNTATNMSTNSRVLELTEVEENLRTLLLDVAQYIDNSPGHASESQVPLPDELANQPLVLRWTGGWVRDKLLGVESHDIDVAINKMTGFQFGLRLKEYLEIPGNPEKYGLEGVASNESQSKKAESGKSKIVGGLHKIEANPEKSKHLETVTTKILGLDIDLVNLRKETYSDDSRNPQMEFGTPEEDALRRDATVNAMFYNITTREIEDFTAKGHTDMANKIIRTPLEPYQTFKDDPLRVLRLIRFASRLNYTIEAEACKWMKDAEIKSALQAKISRERVGVELEKMLRGPDPLMALNLIDQLTLYSTIFSDPAQDQTKVFTPDVDNWSFVVNFVQEILASKSSDILVRDAEERYLIWLLSAIVPYKDAPSPPAIEGKKPPPPVATTVAREGIKATNNVCNVITSSIKNHSEVSMMVSDSNGRKRPAREDLGMAIRRWGSTWRSQTAFALLVNVADDPSAAKCESPSVRLSAHLSAFTNFLEYVQELDLLDAYALKPILDGKALTKALGVPTGPWMKDALDVVMRWQLRNPGKKDTAEAIEEVRVAKDQSPTPGELTSDLMTFFLQLTIRPLFAKTQTQQFERNQDEKTWKGRDSYALDLLRWVIVAADTGLVEKNWHAIVPPLLSMLDDIDTEYKAQGCELLKLLLDKTPPTLLKRTGLGDVFEEALMPCLGYLPTLTPEDESARLLAVAYPALISLSNAFEDPSITSISQTQSQRLKLLDNLIRKGVLMTFTYCPEHAKITTVTTTNLTAIMTSLGLDSVKHLPFILPMLSSILTHPFVTASPPLLLSSVLALQAIILNTWPRMLVHKHEVLKCVTVPWIRMREEGVAGNEFERIREECRNVVQMLRDALQEHVDEFDREVAELVKVDRRLDGLFVAVEG
ncbi:poly A polymerase C-terminal region-like protein [Aureobasidium melanogenum CBS 110374]|uniref:Poly A polymerase C-terminal region-like protein n=1 Tax=Aureobasidium melanogenum (strain CBS 110374) TaxID=1043003 RepID=A0A074W7B1_AURM1|nr:poly A polymerase C-terminal region-like protein [Aureobasidium melanogenum CBS 110374]KEQ65792.1 poly A polymerase C-terminal region-like protein [Aureobasidium melanogenum CBS 110374]